jgi:hypothetical protein
MKVNKKLLDSVKAETNYGTVICCAIYLNHKKTEKMEIGDTVHEQVALLTLKGDDVPAISKKTGFEGKTVCAALYAIINFCGAGEAQG